MKKLFFVIVTILLSLTADAQTKYLVNQDFTKAEKKTNKIKGEYIFDNGLSIDLNLKTIKAQGKEVQDTITGQKFDGFYKNKIKKIYFTKLDQTNNTIIQVKKPKNLTTSIFSWEIIYLLFLIIGSSLFYILHIHKNKEGNSATLVVFKGILIIIGVIGFVVSIIIANESVKGISTLIILISFISAFISLINKKQGSRLD